MTVASTSATGRRSAAVKGVAAIYWPLILSCVTAFAWLAWLGIRRYQGFAAGFLDLGNLSQAVWSASHGQPLVYTDLEGPISNLAWHVELIFFLLAPIYRLFPSPETLIVIQAALFATGALPLYRLALRHLGERRYALTAALIYLLYPVAQTAVLFDVHGDTLAMPLLLFALDAADEPNWARYVLSLLLALSCKFYVAVPVIGLGVVLWFQGRRKWGLGTVLTGALWFGGAFLIRTIFTPPQAALGLSETLQTYLALYFSDLNGLFSPFLLLYRLLNLVIVGTPVVLLARHALYWLLPGLLVAVPAILSTGPGPVFDYRFHHYALVVPFLMAGIVYGAAKLRTVQTARPVAGDQKGRTWNGDLVFTFVLVALFNGIFVQTPLSPQFYSLPYPGSREVPAKAYTPRDTLKEKFLSAEVPRGEPVLADLYLATHIPNREVLFVSHYPDRSAASEAGRLVEILDQVEIITLDVFSPYTHPETLKMVLESELFGLSKARDGLLIFQKNIPGLAQEISIYEAEAAGARQAVFGDAIALLDSRIEPAGTRKFRLGFSWTALPGRVEHSDLVAVSRLGGTADTRFVHLPSLAIIPVSAWVPGQIVSEVFVIAVPDDIPAGVYRLWVGWYERASLMTEPAGPAGRLGEEVLIGVIEVP